MTVFTLAHLSDPHLGPMPQARLRELASKRAIGYMNWKRKRHAIHRSEVLDELVADIHAQKPGHIAITGDLVNIALPLEFAAARQWLESVGSPKDISLVPGNHDAYVSGIREHFPTAWADYMRGDDAASSTPATFPFVRRRGPLVLIGVSTAVPTAPFMATGRLGHEQRHALERLLSQIASDSVFRVLLIHHPPVTSKGRWAARLQDSNELLSLIARYGVDLVLHGHDHRHATIWLDGPDRKIPAIGVPSASAIARGHNQPAAYNLFSVEQTGNGWRCDRRVRGFTGGMTLGDIKTERLI
ncbi:MAG: metallophosphoesterase [Pseudomonadota bacterium]|jgi:3',5'-cyclic AMP phosphodiesterase CpdA